jgi:hypothetical protein
MGQTYSAVPSGGLRRLRGAVVNQRSTSCDLGQERRRHLGLDAPEVVGEKGTEE